MKNKNEKEKEEYKDKGIGRERQRITEWRQRIESATGILLLWSQPGLFSTPLLSSASQLNHHYRYHYYFSFPSVPNHHANNEWFCVYYEFIYLLCCHCVCVCCHESPEQMFQTSNPPPKTVTLSRSQPPSNKHTPQNWTIIFLLLLFLRSLRFALCLWQFRSLHCC